MRNLKKISINKFYKLISLSIQSVILFGLFELGLIKGIVIITIINILSSLLLLTKLFINRKMTAFIFLALVLDVLIVILMKYIIIDTEITSWRSLYINDVNKYVGIYYMNQSIYIIQIVYLLFLKIQNHNNKIFLNNEKNKKHNSVVLGNIIVLVFIFINILFLIFEGDVILKGRSVWLKERSSFPWIEIFNLNLLVSLVIFYVYRIKTKLSHLLYLFNIMVTFYFAITGYRGVLVFFGFCVISIKLLQKDRVTKKLLIRYIIFAIVMLILMNVLALLRIPKNEDSSFFINLVNNFGIHEENIFTSLIGTISQSPENETITYIDSIIKLLPEKMLDNPDNYIRVNNIIGGLFFSQELLNAGHNVGAFYLTEGFYNWGGLGIMISTAIYLCIIILTERLTNKYSDVRIALYILMCGNIYTAVYYGSTTFFKMIFYEIILILLIDLFIKFNFKSFLYYLKQNISRGYNYD